MIASHSRADAIHMPDVRAWRRELLFAAPILALVLSLYYYWFAVRDRYFVFLYFHDMGRRFDTTPFGWVTAGRYWMTGLVASGAVMLLYGAANFILGRVKKNYHAPVWWRVWLMCAVPLVIAIPALVMTVNDPVLPLRNAAQVTGALLIGLALAVRLGEYAAHHAVEYVLLMVDGVALTALLYTPSFLYARTRGNTALANMYLSLGVIAITLLAAVTAIYIWRRRMSIPGALTVFVAYASMHYLFFPLYHHLFWCTDEGSWRDPGYFTYIPAHNNYFSRNALYQLGLWGVVFLLAFGVSRLRIWLRNQRAPEAMPVL